MKLIAIAFITLSLNLCAAQVEALPSRCAITSIPLNGIAADPTNGVIEDTIEQDMCIQSQPPVRPELEDLRIRPEDVTVPVPYIERVIPQAQPLPNLVDWESIYHKFDLPIPDCQTLKTSSPICRTNHGTILQMY